MQMSSDIENLSAPFRYTEIPPHHWQESIQTGSDELLRIEVPWSPHEPQPGIFDFHSQSRLRLERVLSQAADVGRPAVVEIAPIRTGSFPDWLCEEEKGFVPLASKINACGPYERLEIPSLGSAKTLDHLKGFLTEVAELCSLYTYPNGTVQDLRVDLDILEYDSDFLKPNELPELLESRYQTIDRLNKLYGTSYKNFSFSQHPNNLQALLNRRTWLAVYDLRWCARMKRNALRHYIQSSIRELPLPIRVFQPAARRPESTVLFESNLFEVLPDRLAPFVFWRDIHSGVNEAFTRAEDLLFRLKNEGLSVGFCGKNKLCSGSVGVFFAGKYLERNYYRQLCDHIQSGGRVLFPLDVPKLDQELESLKWPQRYKKVWMDESESTLFQFHWGHGCLWIPMEKQSGQIIPRTMSWLRELQNG